jgi:hypothetical protein
VRAALIVFAVVFLFLGSLFLLIGGRPLVDAWRYRQAIRAEAVVTATALRPATETSGTAYEVSYRAVVEGHAHHRTETVPVHLWERAEATSRVPVAYLPDRPETVRVAVDDAVAARTSVIFTAIGTLLILGGLIAAVRAVRPPPPPDDHPVDTPIAIRAHESSYWPRARQSPPFWMGAICLIVSTPLVTAGLLQVGEEWRFARDGVSTDGLILTKEVMQPGRNQHSRGYTATYRLMVPEGAFENRVTLSFDGWSRLTERQTVEVVYLPERPATNRLVGSDEWKGAAILGLIGSGFFAAGATLLRQSIKQ